MTSTRFPALLAVVIVLGLTSCAERGLDPPDATTSPITTPDPSPTRTPSATPSPSESPTPTPSPTPSDEPSPSPSPLAGEPFDGPPVNGEPASLAVIGVAADDVLNVRAGPGVDNPVVATLAPLATDVAATGRARLLPGSIWLELERDGGTGWSNSRFLAFLGSTDDITSQVVAEVGSLPSAETLVGLAAEVANVRASVEPASRIVISDGPSVGDLGEVTVDVVGLGDDSLFAERLVIFATPDESGDGFTVMAIEATLFCGRGTTVDGICV